MSRSRGRRTARPRLSPSPASAAVARSGGEASAGTRSPAVSSAATTPRPAHTTNTLPTPASAISTPASSPDAAIPVASTHATTTLAAVS